MPWSGRSFMLDVKPHSEYANLFVECPENDDRDLIRILKNGVELCVSPESVTDADEKVLQEKISPESESAVNDDKVLQEKIDDLKLDNVAIGGGRNCLRACIKGFCLHPESVTNFSWTEDQHTFSCKLKVEFGEDGSEIKNLAEAGKSLKKNALSVEQFCNQMNKRDAGLDCNKCGQTFINKDAHVLKVFSLPSTDYNDIVDDVFCHLHESTEDVNSKTATSAVPKQDQCFLNSTYLILNTNIIDGVCVGTDSNLLICKNCHQQVGCLHSTSSTVVNVDTLRFYHIATNFYAKTDENSEKIERNYFDLRYETKERYFACLLLSECESQSSLKFVIKSLDSHPKLLVWLLDSYSVIVSGQLDEEDKSNDNREAAANAVPSAVSPCKPFPALKLLFKVLNDSSLSDPRVSGQDASIVRLSLPLEACDVLIKCLESNSESLPPACRHVGQFLVGFLHIAPEI